MIVGRPGLSAAMVGRRSELERLLVMVPADDDPRVALLAGEAGVGKTRLVREVRTQLPETFTVLAGQATREAVGRPFELLLEAVEPYVATWSELPDQLETRGRAVRALLEPIAPHLGEDDQREYYQQELLRAAVEVVRQIVGESPAFLVFEDLHWADTESVKVFGRLGTASGLRLLALGTYRPEGLTRRHPMAQLLEQLERDQSLVHLTLQRLTTSEVAELLAGAYRRPIPIRVVHELHRRTGGNPFFLEELVVAAGEVPPEELPEVPLPWNLSEAVLRHLDGLDPDQLAVLESAAVAGQRFSFDLLLAMTGRDEKELIEILRGLVGTGLLAEEAPDVLAFRHALTHEAVVGSLLGRQRRRLHEAAFEGLQRSGSEDYALLTYHAEGAGRYDDLVEIARKGSAHYLRTGATQEALRLAERGLAEASDDVELLSTASVAAWRTDRLDDATSYAAQWEAAAVAMGSAAVRSRALRFQARVQFEAGRRHGQFAYLEEALRVAEPLGETEELAWVYAQLAEAHMLVENSQTAIEWAERAVLLAERTGAEGAKVRAMVNKGSAMIDSDTEDGVELLDEAARLAESIGDHLSQGRALNNALMASVHWPLERTTATIDLMEEVAERAGLDHFVRMAARNRAFLAEIEGDLDRTISILSGLTWDEQVGEQQACTVQVAALLCERNDPDAAAALLDSMKEPEEPPLRCCYLLGRIYVAALRGERDTVRLLMAEYADNPSEALKGDNDRSMMALLALKVGVTASEVRGFLASLPERNEPSIEHDPASIATVEGALLAAEGSHEAALAAYQQALSADSRKRGAAHVAASQVLFAHSLLALGRNSEASTHAREAWRLLELWPGWLADETLALLRRLGVGPEREGPKELTSREREVAALLAEGLSNAELADRLYISVRTAQVHVSHILTKLGMSSRAEVAAWAVRNGLARTPDRAAG